MSKSLWLVILKMIILLSLSCRYSLAQNPSARLTVESGGYMDFKIYSLNRYEGGLEYTTWSRVQIVFRDTTEGKQTDRWSLAFKANTTNFVSSVPGRNLPLDYVSIEISDTDSLSTTSTLLSGPHELSNSYTDLVLDGDEGTYNFEITYRLDSALLGRAPDYYNTELIFKLDINP